MIFGRWGTAMAVHTYRERHRGVSLVEVVVAVVIVFLVSIFTSISVTQFVATRSVMLQDTHRLYLAEEGYELVRFLRDEDWDALAVLETNTPQYLVIGTSTVAATTTVEVIDGYRRSFQLGPVYRDSNGSIVTATTSGATFDPGGRIVDVTVADERGTTTLQSVVLRIFPE